MRRITSKKDEEKKRKRNQLIVGIFLIFVMVFSTLGYGFLGKPQEENTDDSDDVIYNGYEFEYQNGFWLLNYQGIDLVFNNNPEQVNKIYSIVNPITNYQQKPLYIYSESPSAEAEIYVNLNKIALRVQSACPEDINCTNENLPTKTCEDNFIIITQGNYSNIIQDNNCVLIEGPEEDLLKITDEFLFKTLGIE